MKEVALDVLTDAQFLTPDEYSAPRCPICHSQLWVEIEGRDANGIPDYPDVHVFCQKNETGPFSERHRDWEYDELLSAVGEVIGFCVAEAGRKRRWEVALWGESNIQDLEDSYERQS